MSTRQCKEKLTVDYTPESRPVNHPEKQKFENNFFNVEISGSVSDVIPRQQKISRNSKYGRPLLGVKVRVSRMIKGVANRGGGINY